MKPKDLAKITQHLDESARQLSDFSFLAEMDDELLGLGDDDSSLDLDADEVDFSSSDDAIDFDSETSGLEAAEEIAEGDLIDLALENLIDLLIDADYMDEAAEEAVFDAIATLVNDGSIEDTPDEIASDEEKGAWISVAVPKIKERLIELGLEFDELAV